MSGNPQHDAEALARAAGLDRAWAERREEVLDAIAAARRMGAGFARPGDPAAEPVPAYAAPAARPEPRR
jgi:hypothetical protein